jgi:hypothetical protein
VSSYPTCGAHTCFEDLQILVWNREVFENRLMGSTSDLPYPQISIQDEDGDGLFDLSVTASGFGSVGAGPPRPLTRVWAFAPQSGSWELTDEFLESSDFRIHVAHDADQAVRNGDYAQAVELYRRVIEDPSLQGWMEPETEWPKLAAYAHYKLSVAYWLLDQPQLAQTQMEALETQYPPDDPLYVFVEMGLLFQDAFPSGGLAAGCQAVSQYVEAHSGQVLPFFDYGYGNPFYEAGDLCP